MGQSDNERIVYQNPNGRFSISETPNRRAYGAGVNRGDDRVFVIKCPTSYAFETTDVGALIYFLIKNKQIPKARENEFCKLAPFIIKAFKDNGTEAPMATIPVCEYTNCLRCPLYDNGHCQSPGGQMAQALIKATEYYENHPQQLFNSKKK